VNDRDTNSDGYAWVRARDTELAVANKPQWPLLIVVVSQHYIYIFLPRPIIDNIHPHLNSFHTPLRAIISSIARVSIDHIHEVPRNPPLGLLAGVELVVPKVAVWVANGRAVAARDAAVVVVAIDLKGSRSVQKTLRILMYIEEDLADVVEGEVGARVAVGEEDFVGCTVF